MAGGRGEKRREGARAGGEGVRAGEERRGERAQGREERARGQADAITYWTCPKLQTRARVLIHEGH